MSDALPTALLSSIAELARRAGEKIMEVYGQQVEVTHKADASPLTVADLRSHQLIVAGLTALTPHIPVLSEEASDIPFPVRKTWSRYWLVDPLDGTKEFLSRNGQFTVNIALIENHAPVLGVVSVPAQRTVYTGSRTGGAFRQVGEQAAIPIHTTSPAPPILRVVGSRSHRDQHTDALIARLGPHDLVAVGSSLKFCLVAEGNADFYPRLGPTSEWDTAAAQAVVEAAGGAVTMLDGTALRYNTKESLLNPHFLVVGDRRTDWITMLSLSVADA
jgi:3'(2'), 5'-bisphosphate nucleotidase